MRRHCFDFVVVAPGVFFHLMAKSVLCAGFLPKFTSIRVQCCARDARSYHKIDNLIQAFPVRVTFYVWVFARCVQGVHWCNGFSSTVCGADNSFNLETVSWNNWASAQKKLLRKNGARKISQKR